MKKWKRTSIIVVLFFVSVLFRLGSNVKADNFPISDGEKILDTNELSTDTMEIYTLKDGKNYKKLLRNKDNVWTIVKEEKIESRKTGLKTTKNSTKNSALGKSIENKLKSAGYNLSQLPTKVDYSSSSYLPPIGDQQENDCVAWSTGYYVRTFQQAKDIGWNVKSGDTAISNHVFSPSFIYNQINGGTDDGGTLEDAGDLLENVGAATLKDFPYNPPDYTTQPTNAIKQKAAVNKIKDWEVLYTYEDSSDYIIQKTKQYLNTGDIMVAGMEIGYRFEDPTIKSDGTSIITIDRSDIGGHAIAVVGYDDSIVTSDGTGAFKLANSWGTSWGDKGFSYISYKAYVNDIIEGIVYTDMTNGKIVDDIQQVNSEILSGGKFKLTWDAAVNASGYKIYDENEKLLSTVESNSYTETASSSGNIVRYVQPFNSISEGSLISVSLNITVSNNSDPDIYFDGTTTVIPYKVAANKEWNIKFTKEANQDTLTSENIYVLDSSGNRIDVKISYGSDKILRVTPLSYYKSGETYCLYIDKKVASKENVSLKKSLRYEFTIE
ncbi:C1 family peptidase [Clostridiaceae bacterium UIB06]|uniref:C1 family peptidase n=1 Tax=Clostridium thailandense TaxID=2794346 RepID=A0A949X3B3_9CLOT|nr:C1 family peptidase [Clostridium thailandense]MBV7274279.1 C1 family peptidase [Clostridium thailandense]MCH5136179.1 C1 family peptidase [Clostridiaceae bacterium UIB06]